MDEKLRPRTPLARDRWIRVAFDVLADKGLDGLRIEVLAKRCGVTKGSFYWHFTDRRELLDEVLRTWKEGRIRDIRKQARAEPGQELTAIYHMIDVYSANRNRKGILIELAVRDWARRDPAAAQVVEEVDTTRLECGRQLFLARGLPEDEAAGRAVLLYAYVFGQSLMRFEDYQKNIPGLRGLIAHRIAT